MEKVYSKDIPTVIKSNGKILVPYNIQEYQNTEEYSGYQFDYFEIEDTGQDITDTKVLSALTAKTNKYIGIEILGVMCSATAEDQWGLGSIRTTFNSTTFGATTSTRTAA